MLFETSRLIVRPLRFSDFDAYFEMQSNPNVHLYTCSPVDDSDAARTGLEHHIACYTKPNNNWWIWAIERKTDEAFVGTAAVINSDNEIVGNGPEIGYRFLERYWGNGYGSEICDPLIEYAFGQRGLNSVFATVDVLNVPSVKILDRCELRFVKQYLNQTDNCADRVYYLTIDQFREKRKS